MAVEMDSNHRFPEWSIRSMMLASRTDGPGEVGAVAGDPEPTERDDDADAGCRVLRRARVIHRRLAVLCVCGLVACGGDSQGSSESERSNGSSTVSEPAASPPSSPSVTDGNAGSLAGDPGPGPTTLPGTDADWALVAEKVLWAVDQGYAELDIGDLIARIGETFVGTPYAPYTLEAPGDEALVIELEELDCVTFVENVLALARFVHMAPDNLTTTARPRSSDDQRAGNRGAGNGSDANTGDPQRALFSGILQDIRYRGGELGEYPSRLHYFSEWISDNDGMGLMRDLSRELGGVVDDEPIDFMTTHSDAYRQLGEDPSFLTELQQVEARLNAEPRYFVPEDRIASVAEQIQDGDIIAATSTVEGLDIAHTGIALWRNGRLHLLHAPLVDGVVGISEVPLAERILRMGGQDGVMVARPTKVR